MEATKYMVSEMTDPELDTLAKILTKYDPHLMQRVAFMKSKLKMSYQNAMEYLVTDNPVLWAKVYLNWEARDYQEAIIIEGKNSKQLVLRLGRRLGKTDSMCILILWYSYTQKNRGANDKYSVVIATPYETQIDLIFKRLHQLVEGSPVLKNLICRDIHHNLCFKVNGIVSSILGLTAGANNSSGGANSTRGQDADLLILDECDYIGAQQITNILNIRNEDPERIRLICASTPSGKHEEYYRWCTGASKRYYPSESDIKNSTFTKYEVETKKVGEGNGWTEIYAPSTVNKELLKINSDTQQRYLDDIRDELSEMRFVQEVMAEFGEEEMGVYQKRYILQALKEGEQIHWKYLTKYSKEKRDAYLLKTMTSCIRILGVDWDKYGAATNMLCLEYDPYFINEQGNMTPMFKVLFRIEIPRGEFTYTNALDKIITLNEEYNFEYIAIDRGYGEMQLELLHKYGIQHPQSGLADKVVGYQFSQKIEVMDPYTKKKDQKPIKPFMVNQSVNLFEKGKIILDPKDKDFREQLESYRIKSFSSSGLPMFSESNEHSIDAMNLALLIFQQKHEAMLRRVFTGYARYIKGLDNRDMDVKDRLKKENEFSIYTPSSIKNKVAIVVNPRNRINSVHRVGTYEERQYDSPRRSVKMFERKQL